ncbi:MAG: hypothetical protein AAF661_04155 [Pseudomonadota bacterium]
MSEDKRNSVTSLFDTYVTLGKAIETTGDDSSDGLGDFSLGGAMDAQLELVGSVAKTPSSTAAELLRKVLIFAEGSEFFADKDNKSEADHRLLTSVFRDIVLCLRPYVDDRDWKQLLALSESMGSREIFAVPECYLKRGDPIRSLFNEPNIDEHPARRASAD